MKNGEVIGLNGLQILIQRPKKHILTSGPGSQFFFVWLCNRRVIYTVDVFKIYYFNFQCLNIDTN